MKSKRASRIIPASLREQHEPPSLHGPGTGRCQKPGGGRSRSGWGLTLSPVKGWSPCLAQACRARDQSPAPLGPAWVLRTSLSLDPIPSETRGSVPALPRGVSARHALLPRATPPAQPPTPAPLRRSCTTAVTNASEHRASEPCPPAPQEIYLPNPGGSREGSGDRVPQQLSRREEENYE